MDEKPKDQNPGTQKKNYSLFMEKLPGWELRDRICSEVFMYRAMEQLADAAGLAETKRALAYARDAHAGQLRKAAWNVEKQTIPYINHPLMMACQAAALGIRDDEILASTMLHDVVEDCGVRVEDLPFSEPVRHIVDLLTRRKDPSRSREEVELEYFRRIRTDPKAAVVKVLDRCNNISTCAQSFTEAKIIRYIEETEHFVLPLTDFLYGNYPEYRDLAFLVRYHIVSVTETLKNMLMRIQRE